MITEDSYIDDCKKIKELQPAADLFSGRRDGQPKDEEGKTFKELNQMFPTWNATSMVEGIRRLYEIGKTEEKYVYSVYDEDEIAKDKSLEVVKLVRFPGDPQKPFVISCAGGAYVSVCSLSESFPVAAGFNKLGYTVFALNYRTSSAPGKENAVANALDDLAAAVKYVFSHMEELNLKCKKYAVCGFSAGGNLINMWGLQTVGYEKYHMPKPDIMFPCYGVSTLSLDQKEDENIFLKIAFGEQYEYEDVKKHDVLSNITSEYPPCYIVACRDDDMVPASNSELMAQTLSKYNIPNELEIGNVGGHGFGDGRGTDAENWIERAVHFWEQKDIKVQL